MLSQVLRKRFQEANPQCLLTEKTGRRVISNPLLRYRWHDSRLSACLSYRQTAAANHWRKQETTQEVKPSLTQTVRKRGKTDLRWIVTGAKHTSELKWQRVSGRCAACCLCGGNTSITELFLRKERTRTVRWAGFPKWHRHSAVVFFQEETDTASPYLAFLHIFLYKMPES